MRTQTLLLAAVTVLAAGTLPGCGIARQLTTQTRTVAYTASLPPMPANTMGHTQFSISDEVRTTYSKYHGGVDWSRLAYQVQNGSAVQPATLKLYSSLDSSLTASQLDQQATLFETLTLPPSATQSISLTQAPKNEPLRSFLASALSQHDVTTLYVYGVTSSSDPTAMISVQSFTVQVQVHGSYF
jgi:hypothetical protein